MARQRRIQVKRSKRTREPRENLPLPLPLPDPIPSRERLTQADDVLARIDRALGRNIS